MMFVLSLSTQETNGFFFFFGVCVCKYINKKLQIEFKLMTALSQLLFIIKLREK